MPNKIYIDIECIDTKFGKMYGSSEADYITGKPKSVSEPMTLSGTPYTVLNDALQGLVGSKAFNLVFSTFNYMNDNKTKVNKLIKNYKLTNTHVVHAKSNNPKIKELRKQILAYLNKNNNKMKSNMKNKKSIAYTDKASKSKSSKSNKNNQNDKSKKTKNTNKDNSISNSNNDNNNSDESYAKSTFLNSEKLLSRFSRFSVQLTNQGRSLEKLSKQKPQATQRQGNSEKDSAKQTNSKISKSKKVQPKVSSSDESNKQLKMKLQSVSNRLSIVEKLASLPRHTKKISLKNIHQWLGDSDSVGLAKEIIKYLTNLDFITKAKHNTYKVNLRIHKNIF